MSNYLISHKIVPWPLDLSQLKLIRRKGGHKLKLLSNEFRQRIITTVHIGLQHQFVGSFKNRKWVLSFFINGIFDEASTADATRKKAIKEIKRFICWIDLTTGNISSIVSY